MKILLLVSSMHAGGAERVAATLANGWAARGDQITLMPTYSSKGTCFYPLSDDVELLWLADRAGTRSGGVVAAWQRLRCA
ncbi:glycosyltransferase [Bordetella pertussis]|nr:glycosyltransferase [Bordetella pertussis]